MTGKRRNEKNGQEDEWLYGMARPGKDWTAILPSGVKLEMVWVEPGTFKIGSDNHHDDEKTLHKVTLSKGYWIGKYPFTQEQRKAIDASKGNSCYWNGDRLPVVCVSWNEAVECCEQLNGLLADNLQSGWHFSLPLGVQWEFAARGGVKSRGYKYSGSDNIGEVAWYDENAEGRTHEVGLLQPNELGIYDMSGNVLEWCHDWYGEFPLMSLMDPGPSYIGDPSREFRGGSYHHVAKDCTVTYRESCGTSWSSLYIGFRVALVPIV